jgi:hypothetical protein
MNQNELKNLINEIHGHAFSLKEDMEYGLKANQEIRLTTEEETELNQISDKLMSISEQVGMQFIIQDFE